MTNGASTGARISLPTPVKASLEALTESMRGALGEDLVAVLVHGSVARGEYLAGETDVDVIVVLAKAGLAQLDAIGEALLRARYAARIQPMFLVESEIAGAADAFPLLYDSIARHHVLVTGRDPFEGVVVQDEHRGRRIEQELREAQIHLRRAVADACGAREALGGAVARKVQQLRAPLHALLVVKGVPCDERLPAVLAKLAEVYGLDLTALGSPRERPEPAHAALTALLERTIDDVDRR
ncbi:MAG: hypothetical protein JWP97_5964 [Labilithrix sp.]|nr:hypothetical protein [Labilithrix sp.]